jgi:hypothetical protein
LIHEALKHPNAKCTIRSHEGKYRVTYPTARADLLGLVDAGLLTKSKDGKTMLFYPVHNLSERLHLPASASKQEKERIREAVAVTKLKTTGEVGELQD